LYALPAPAGLKLAARRSVGPSRPPCASPATGAPAAASVPALCSPCGSYHASRAAARQRSRQSAGREPQAEPPPRATKAQSVTRQKQPRRRRRIVLCALLAVDEQYVALPRSCSPLAAHSAAAPARSPALQKQGAAAAQQSVHVKQAPSQSGEPA
jgi:hypothetical protein